VALGRFPARVNLVTMWFWQTNRLKAWVAVFCLGLTTQLVKASEKKIELLPIDKVKGPPRVFLFVSHELQTCLKDTANPDGVVKSVSSWQLICPISEFLKVSAGLRSRPSTRNLSDSLVISRVLINTIQKVREQHLGVSARPSSSYLTDSNSQSWTEGERKFAEESAPFLKEVNEWLMPQILTYKKSGESPLIEESASVYLEAIAEGWRFNEVISFLDEHGPKLGDGKRTTTISLFKNLVGWIDRFGPSVDSAWPLRSWVLRRIIAQRPPMITGNQGESEFYLWTQSLRLQPAPSTQEAKKNALQVLQDLWIAYPKMTQGIQLKELAKLLGLEKEFQPLPLKEYSLEQLMTRAKAQVRALDSLGALRTMKRVRQLPAETLSLDEVWDALTYHVRVLRLLDERTQIPSTIQGYLGFKDFLTAPNQGFKNPSEAQKYFSRLHELARLYWNYDDSGKALTILDRIVSKNQVLKTDYFLGPALVIRARIAEQSQDRVRAMDLMDQALNSKIGGDVTLDLLWRKVFLQLDRVLIDGVSPETLLSLMEPIRRYADKDISEKSKWHYWIARFHSLNKKQSESVRHFKIAYNLDRFSFYSNVSALELQKVGEVVEGWQPLELEQRIKYEEHSWETPNWELYMSQNGTPTASYYRDLARVLLLVRIGELQLAKQALPDLDKFLWSRILSSSVSWKSRRELARTVSYIRKSMNDPMGALRVAEIARQAGGPEYDTEDYLNLYPLPFWDLIEMNAGKKGLNPQIVASLIRQESAFNPEAKSWANAIGLMQIIPPVAEEEAKLMGLQGFEPENLYNPGLAIQLGTHHLSRLFVDFDRSWICSIAGYNAGSPPVRKWLSFYPVDIPEAFIERIPFLETRNYVKSIIRNYINYFRVYGAKGENLDLAEILKMPQTTKKVVENSTENR
jgi:soluble lytic murein transglycosylase-like protein